MRKVLITGASGFVGGFLVEECLKRGWEVFAGIRATSSKAYLQNPAIQFLTLDLSDQDALTHQFRQLQFDTVIHVAGLTKSADPTAYFTVNTTYTKHLIDALRAANSIPRQFIFVSSLAAYGPADNQPTDIVHDDLDPQPLTNYGKSKLAAEQYLRSLSDFPYLIIRPTAVYGPREKDLFTLFQMIYKGIEPQIGFQDQQLSFVYVQDLVGVIADMAEQDVINKAYFISDGKTYSSRQLGTYIQNAFGKRSFRFKVPIPLVALIAWINQGISKLTGQYPPLNPEKVKELKSINWNCDITPLQADFNYQPKFPLSKGISITAKWYLEQQWLK